MRVAAISDNRVVQVWSVTTHVRDTRRILRPEVDRKTLLGVTQGFQVHRVARPRHRTGRAELTHLLAGASRPIDPIHFFPGNGDRLSNGPRVSIVHVELSARAC